MRTKASEFFRPAALDLEHVLQMKRRIPALPVDPNWVWDEPKNLDFETVYPDGNAGTPDDTPPLPC
jgi:hypothetical protein